MSVSEEEATGSRNQSQDSVIIEINSSSQICDYISPPYVWPVNDVRCLLKSNGRKRLYVDELMSEIEQHKKDVTVMKNKLESRGKEVSTMTSMLMNADVRAKTAQQEVSRLKRLLLCAEHQKQLDHTYHLRLKRKVDALEKTNSYLRANQAKSTAQIGKLSYITES